MPDPVRAEKSRGGAMMTTDNITFPILLWGRGNYFKYWKTPVELVLNRTTLKMVEKDPRFFVVDNTLGRFKITNTSVVRGYGPLAGYFFQGPFLNRRVVFRAELSLDKQLDFRSVAKLIARFMSDTQGVRKDDIARFWAVFEEFAPTAPPTLSALWDFYDSFQWGDMLESEE